MNIVMRTEKVLKLLKEHKENHVKEYTLQIQGWKIAMEKWQNDLSSWAKGTSENANEMVIGAKRPQEPNKPGNYIYDYDNYINIISYHVEETINLSEHEFNQIVEDQFSWKHTFLSNSNLYSNG